MRNVASGCALVVIAFVYFLGARALPAGQGEPGPRFVPYLLAGLLLALGTSIAVHGLRDRQLFDGALARPAVLITLTGAYALAFTTFGFLVSTVGYTAGVVALVGERGWRALVIPVATTVLLYLAFVLGLGVIVP